MEEEELGGNFLIAVDELGLAGLWASVKEIFESRLPLQRVTVQNKFEKTVLVDRLPAQYVQATDKRLLRLKPYVLHAPVWYRLPYAHIILVSTADASSVKAVLAAVRRCIAELECWRLQRDCGPEWAVVYVRPFGVDVQDKGAAKVYQKLVDEFGAGRRERVVRLDPQNTRASAAGALAAAAASFQQQPNSLWGSNSTGAPGGYASPGAGVGAGSTMLLPAALGLEDLDVALRECVKASFQARQAAYVEDVRQRLNQRLDATWSFASFYVVKDSLAQLLEGAGLLEDAHNEYTELEALYVETLKRKAEKWADDFGGNADGDDVALLLLDNAALVARRRIGKSGAPPPPEFRFRQWLFAAQARLLLKLGRPIDVAERGLDFVHFMLELLQEQEARGSTRRGFKEAWAFSACLALVTGVTALLGRIDNGDKATPRQHGPQAPMPGMHNAVPTSAAAAGGVSGTARHAVLARTDAGSTAFSFMIDWGLGLPQTWSAEAAMPAPDPEALAGRPLAMLALQALRRDGDALAATRAVRSYYALQAQTYLLAWQQLVRLGALVTRQATPSHAPIVSPVSCTTSLPANGWMQPLGAAAVGGAGAATSSASSRAAAAPAVSAIQGTGSSVQLQGVYHYARLVCLDAGATQDKPRVEASPMDRMVQTHILQSAGVGCGSPLRHRPGFATESPAAPAAALMPAQGGPPRVFAGASSLPPRPGQTQPNASYQPLSTAALQSGPNKHSSVPGAPAAGHTDVSTSGDRPSSAAEGAASSTIPALHRITPTTVFNDRRVAALADGLDPVDMAGDTPSLMTQLPRAQTAASDPAPASSRNSAPGTTVGSSSTMVPATALAYAPQQPGPSSAVGQGAGGLPPPAPASSSFFSKVDKQFDKIADRVSSFIDRPVAMFEGRAADSAGGMSGGGMGGSGRQPPGLPLFPPGLSPADSNAPLSQLQQQPHLQHASHHRRSGSAGVMSPPPSGGGTVPAPAALPWLSDWRLRLALSSIEQYHDLTLQLALLSACCWASSGRIRSACLVFADAALMLLQRQSFGAALHLLDTISSVVAVDGWLAILGLLLPQVIRCQVALDHALLPHTCLRLLGLPSSVVAAADRHQVLQNLLSLSRRTADADSAACQLSTIHTLTALPAPRRYSAFYGMYSDGRPRLQPTPMPNTWEPLNGSLRQQQQRQDGIRRQHGAALVCAGDMVPIDVLVVSNFPEPVQVSDVCLVLGALPHGAGGAASSSSVDERHQISKPGQEQQQQYHHHQQQQETGSSPQLSFPGMTASGDSVPDAADPTSTSSSALRPSRSASNLQLTAGPLGATERSADRPAAADAIPATAAAARRSQLLRQHSRSHSCDQKAKLDGGEGERVKPSAGSEDGLLRHGLQGSALLAQHDRRVGAAAAGGGARVHGSGAGSATAQQGSGAGPTLHGDGGLGAAAQQQDTPGLLQQGRQGLHPLLEAEDLLCCNLIAVAWRQAASAAAGASLPPDGGPHIPTVPNTSEPDDDGWEVGGYSEEGLVELCPGVNRLTFLVSPAQPAAYFARCIELNLGCLELRIPVPRGTAALTAAAAAVGLHGLTAVGAGVTAATLAGSEGQSMSTLRGEALGLGWNLGDVTPGGDIVGEAVLLEVVPAPQRLALAAVCAGSSSLVLGQQGWLGLLLVPGHQAGAEHMAAARLHVRPHGSERLEFAIGDSKVSGHASNTPMAALVSLPPVPHNATEGSSHAAATLLPANELPHTPPSMAPLIGGSCLDLSAYLGSHALAHPLLAWLPVRVTDATLPASTCSNSSSSKGHCYDNARMLPTAGMSWRSDERPEVVQVARLPGQVSSLASGMRGRTGSRSALMGLAGKGGAPASGAGSGSGPNTVVGLVPSQAAPAAGLLGPDLQGDGGASFTCAVEVGLEYEGFGSSRRSHRRWLDVAVRPAFRVEITAAQLPGLGGAAVVSCRLYYQGACPALLHSIQLLPAGGLHLLKTLGPDASRQDVVAAKDQQGRETPSGGQEEGSSARAGLDLLLPVGAVMGQAWIVRRRQGGTGTDQHSEYVFFSSPHDLVGGQESSDGGGPPACQLLMTYTPQPALSSSQLQPSFAVSGLDAAASEAWQARLPPLPQHLWAAGTVPQGVLPPAASPSSSAAAPMERCCMSYSFVLEFPVASATGGLLAAAAATGAAVVAVPAQQRLQLRLLGPVGLARVGQPVTIAWQIVRPWGPPARPRQHQQHQQVSHAATLPDGGHAASASNGGDALWYEVVAPPGNPDAWHLGAWGSRGVVRLAVPRGSVATVEAVVVPLASGALPPPRLLLRGLQDVVDDSHGSGFTETLVWVSAG